MNLKKIVIVLLAMTVISVVLMNVISAQKDKTVRS